MNPTEKRRAHLARAAKMVEEKREEDAAEDAAYYQKITSGTPWRLFGLGAIICLLINVLVTIDTFKDGHTVNLPEGSFYHERLPYSKANALVMVDDHIFTPYYKHFVSVDFSSFTLTKTYLFNQPKYISFDAHTLGNRKRFSAYKRISIFEWFPYLQFMLLIPLFVFLLKRQKPWFKFMRLMCITLIFPASLVILYFQLN